MWASPLNLLILFFCSQLLIYFDRGLISAVLPALSSGFHLTSSQCGLIGSSFILGYMLACPLFAFFSRSFSVYRLMAAGLVLWVVAVMLCGLTNNFIVLLGGRILTGVGEASFAGLAPACIDDVSPKKWRTLWLSFFYAGLPIGGAIGYVCGGELVHGIPVMAGAVVLDWHTGFLVEAALMLPVILTVFVWPDTPMKDDEPASPLSPPSPALIRRASTHLARYGSVSHSLSSTALVLPPRQSDLNRRASMPASNNRLSADHGDVRYGGNVAVRNNAFAASSPHASIPSYHASLSPPPSAAASYSLPNMAAALPHTPHSMRASSSVTSLNIAGSVHSPSPSPRAIAAAPRLQSTPVLDTASDRVMHSSSISLRAAPSAPAAVSSPNRISRSPHHALLTVATPHRSSPHSAPFMQGYSSQSANNLYTAWQPSPSHAPITVSPFHQQSMQLPSHFTLSPSAAHSSPAEDEEDHWYSALWDSEQIQFAADLQSLFADNIYICVVLGYSSLAFVIGALSFWAPVDFAAMLDMSIEQSTKAIGIITFFCGILGTGFGGWALDYWKKGKSSRKEQAVLASLEICVVFTSVSIALGVLSILMRQAVPSLALLALSNFFLFSTSAPINACLLSVAPPALRSLAMAMSILLMHLLGDLPSPFLLGWLTEALGGEVRVGLLCLLSWLCWTVMFWSFGAVLARRQVTELKLRALAEGMTVDEKGEGMEEDAVDGGGKQLQPEVAATVQQQHAAQREERKERSTQQQRKDDEKMPLLAH